MNILLLGEGIFCKQVSNALTESGINHTKYEGIKEEASLEFSKYDTIVTASFGHIFSKDEITDHNIINLHPSPLPMYRGCSPLQSQLLAGESLSCVTLVKTVPAIDQGEILRTKPFYLRENYNDALFTSGKCAGELLVDHFNNSASYTHKIMADDVEIFPTDSILKIYRKADSTKHAPFVRRPDGKKLKLFGIGNIEGIANHNMFGRVVGDKIGISRNYIAGVQKVQLEGKKKISLREYARGAGREK